jgi:hypothetical protein
MQQQVTLHQVLTLGLTIMAHNTDHTIIRLKTYKKEGNVLRQHLLTTKCNTDGAVKNYTAGSFLIWATVSCCTNVDIVFELAQKSI